MHCGLPLQCISMSGHGQFPRQTTSRQSFDVRLDHCRLVCRSLALIPDYTWFITGQAPHNDSVERACFHGRALFRFLEWGKYIAGVHEGRGGKLLKTCCRWSPVQTFGALIRGGWGYRICFYTQVNIELQGDGEREGTDVYGFIWRL